jgi:hypothetical protein
MDTKIKHKTATFRQVNKKGHAVHHDALEFPDGQIVLLTILKQGQQAKVLQLPAKEAGIDFVAADKPTATID